ncbi:hypothetical protein V6N13_032510 [Hibiscus sabdariffa]|uniref:Uncharacterized protein n=1 Tax=Hibiscus sabdariffa TaxID=183260 RepID=A0ABR2C1K8_9ROSI
MTTYLHLLVPRYGTRGNFRTLFQVESETLIASVNEEEVRKALFEMDELKASGPDGLQVAFYVGPSICTTWKMGFYHRN